MHHQPATIRVPRPILVALELPLMAIVTVGWLGPGFRHFGSGPLFQAGRGSASAALRSAPRSPASVVVTGAGLPAAAPEVLLVDASYTAGLGAQPATLGYAYLTAAKLGWRAEVNGESGTGFLNSGPQGGRPFLERVRTLNLPV